MSILLHVTYYRLGHIHVKECRRDGLYYANVGTLEGVIDVVCRGLWYMISNMRGSMLTVDSTKIVTAYCRYMGLDLGKVRVNPRHCTQITGILCKIARLFNITVRRIGKRGGKGVKYIMYIYRDCTIVRKARELNCDTFCRWLHEQILEASSSEEGRA